MLRFHCRGLKVDDWGSKYMPGSVGILLGRIRDG